MVDITLHIPVDELCQLQGIEIDIVVEVVEYGIAHPIADTDYPQWTFDLESAHWIKKRLN